jgi:hypothetical protein
MNYQSGFCLFISVISCGAQTVIGSARVACGSGHEYPFQNGAPIVGAVINQTKTNITDLEVELSIITRDKKGQLKRQRDTHFVVVPSLNQTGIVANLPPDGNVYFSIPGSRYGETWDRTCPVLEDKDDEILNVAAIAITRINGKSLLFGSKGGKPPKQAPLESMLQVPRQKFEREPTQSDMVSAMLEQNLLLQATIINKQLQDCLSGGTWACTFNNNTNVNVVISEK